jgi:uncharacterized membrane protein (DUF4010 family)
LRSDRATGGRTPKLTYVPVQLRNALTFGALFIGVLLTSVGAEATFGTTGFLATTFVTGLVSSGTAVTLVSTSQITQQAAIAGMIVGTAVSILVETALAANIFRKFVRPARSGTVRLN